MVQVKESLSKQYNQLFDIVPPAAIRAVDIKLSAVPDIIKLTLGEPDFAVPDVVKEAVKKAVDDNDSHYAPSQGTLALRQAISDYIHECLSGPIYEPKSEISVTIGASEAIYDSLSALFNRGETILVPTPTFCFYQAEALRLGLKVVEINTAPSYLFTAEMFEKAIQEHPEAKGLVLNFPGNPTGVTYDEKELQELAAAIKKTDVLVLSDEIYAELTYGQTHQSITRYIPEQTILISGLSKSHAMTGYRVGFIAGPKALMKMVGLAHSGVVTTAPGPMMAGALAALTVAKDAPKKMRDTYQKRRDIVLAGLQEAGFTAPTPKGAFYIFAKIPDFLPQDDEAFVYELGEKAQVGTIPGSVFGAGGEGHIRISYATSTEKLEEAMQRVIAYAKTVKEATELSPAE
ncbi:aminotransferase class I/II-fold pyridoxal phosphate-dependent enzyme [Fructobacillus americanaquae]|uniref:Aminotransferase n=1 Tax=Fructobacillus americanaquae TaxID=2940302 RepID=A0ABY5C3Y9_9LACO|nr:aminotransferase class I/II-fold pyridoxal phosphate-dependent enzyme [Fructobacillus americanaquae]USS92298.1 aminotransferase class I/II-fold pyridoxal phosphate-dependent enzyme [Fructobacillus americanaquae]